MQTFIAIKVNQRRSQTMVLLQSFDQSVGIVVGTSFQGLARDVIDHVHFGRMEFVVVRASACLVYEATRDSLYKQAVVDFEFDDGVKFLFSVA